MKILATVNIRSNRANQFYHAYLLNYMQICKVETHIFLKFELNMYWIWTINLYLLLRKTLAVFLVNNYHWKQNKGG